MTEVEKYSGDEFHHRQIGMLKEVLQNYGPVHRFWFDGSQHHPKDLNVQAMWQDVYKTIRDESPTTLISPYRGDICASTTSLYTNDGPAPNSTDVSSCAEPSPTGKFFHPTEMHGITVSLFHLKHV